MARSSKKKAEISAKPSEDEIEKILVSINKKVPGCGLGTVRGKFSNHDDSVIGVVQSGSIALDKALGIGGYPRGRVIEIYGPESSGKTTLALHAIANAQAEGGLAAFIDAEHALDVGYAESLGVNLEELLLTQPDNGEQALEAAEALVRSQSVSVVVIDSVAALVPRAEIEGDMGDMQPGLQARLMSQALRKIAGAVHNSNCLLIFINQIRYKIGVKFGNPETTSGGNALKFYASVRLDIRRLGGIKKGDDDPTGNRTKVKVVKNKVAPPFKKAEFDILYGEGIDIYGELLDFGIESGDIMRSGAWYSIAGGERMGQGRDKARFYLMEDADLFKKLHAKARQGL
jgi:recombination protein RecA